MGLSVFFGVLSHISRGIRWQYVLSPMGYFPKKMNLIAAVFVGYLLNLTIPRSGEISRALVITRYDSVPFDKSFGTIITERIVDLLIMCVLIVLVFVLQFGVLSDFLLDKISVRKFLIFLGIGSLGLLIFLYWIYKSNSNIAHRIKNMFLGVREGILSIFSLKDQWIFWGHTLFIWLMYLLMFYVVFFSFEETQYVAISDVLTAFVVGSFAIIFTNGGFGAYPLFIAEILLLFGINDAVGTTLGWIMWIAQFLMILFFGVLSLVLLPIINKNEK